MTAGVILNLADRIWLAIAVSNHTNTIALLCNHCGHHNVLYSSDQLRYLVATERICSHCKLHITTEIHKSLKPIPENALAVWNERRYMKGIGMLMRHGLFAYLNDLIENERWEIEAELELVATRRNRDKV